MAKRRKKFTETIVCPRCEGSGWEVARDGWRDACRRCDGDGHVEQEVDLDALKAAHECHDEEENEWRGHTKNGTAKQRR